MMKIAALMAALAAPMAAEAGVRQDSVTVMPEDAQMRAFFEDWGFSDAIIAGDTVYLSGFVVGLRRDETDLKPAYVRAFDEIAKVLGRAGVSWDDVVDITTYHTDLTTQMPAITAVKRNYVKAPYPAWTAVQVVRLIPDRGITEIKLIAKRPAKPKR